MNIDGWNGIISVSSQMRGGNHMNMEERLDFIEFKQNLILLKQPQHKASVFYKLTLDDFLKIRDLTLNFENQIKSGARTSISDYESELFEICPLVKTYPSASTLIAKVLMSEDVFNSLFSSSN